MSAIVFKYRKADSTSFVSRAAIRKFAIDSITSVYLCLLFGGTFAKFVSYIKRLKVKQY